MKLLDVAIRFNKSLIHNQYVNIDENFKDYDKITRKEMLNKIIEFYTEDYKRIIDYCSYDEIKFLELVAKNKDIDYDDVYYRLHRKFFVIPGKKVTFPEELDESIRLALKNVDYKEIKKRDKVNKRIIGIMKLYGIITLRDLCYEYVSNFDDFDNVNICLDYVKKSLALKYYIFIDNNVVYYNNYYDYIEEIVDNWDDGIKDILFTREEIESIGNSKYDIDDKYFNELLEIFNKYNIPKYQLDYFIENTLLREFNLYFNPKIIEDRIMFLLRLYNNEKINLFHDICSEVINVIINIPLLVLKGNTMYNMFDHFIEKKMEIESEKRLEKLKDNDEVNNYKRIRKDSVEALSSLEKFLEDNNLIDKYMNLYRVNKIDCGINSFYSYISTFISIDDEERPFNKYFKEKVNLSHKYYSTLNYIRNFHYSSLFKVLKVDKELCKVLLLDTKTNNEYEIIDINLSNYEFLVDKYIYTSLFNIENIYLTSGYILLFEDDDLNEIIRKVDKEKKYIKLTSNDEMIEILAFSKVYSKNKTIGFKTIDVI